MRIPTDYEDGYKAARLLDPELADRYIALTTMGDPAADELTEELSSLPRGKVHGYIEAAMNRDEGALADAPQAIREFFDLKARQPDWLDLSSHGSGTRLFFREAKLMLGGLLGGVLVEGFSTNIAKSFVITGRLRDQGVRRLRQNNRHVTEIFMPGGLERDSDGWKLSVRLCLVHAQIRYLLKQSQEWDADAWGTPLSAAHMGFAITAFSARLLRHMEKLGATVSDPEERRSFMAVWRYAGYLMGVPESLLFQDEEDALLIFQIGLTCEPPPDFESIVMANALINSAPLVLGMEAPEQRRDLTKYVYGISRALIGDSLADELRYPKSSTFGVLPWFRAQHRFGRLLDNVVPKRFRNRRLDDFTGLLEASLFERGGITYGLPDHVYAEESGRW